jgi:predicted HTH domain antitoxin
MSTFTVPLPDTLSEPEAKLMWALKLYEEGHISSGKAAEIAGRTRHDFMLIMSEHGFPVFDIPEDEIESEVENANRASHFGHQLSDRPG